MNARFTLLMAALATAGLVLTACGGGGRSEPAPAPAEATAVPESALLSSSAMTGFVKSQTERDDKEPLTLSASLPPMSDTDEPVPIL